MKNTFLALFVTVAASHASAQAPTWRVDFLGGPQPTWSGIAAQAVNDAGTTAGLTYISGFKHAWIAGLGQPPELLPLPPGANWSEANDINASGVVAGSVLIGGVSQAIVWQPGPSGYQYQLVPSSPGGVQPFDARGINDAGEVVGKLGVLSGSYVWTPGASVIQIPTATFPVVPEDINNARQIVGDTYRMDLDTMVLEDLGNPTGTGYNYMYTKLSVINDAGQCGGYAVVATGQSQNKQAVRYADGAGWRAFNSSPTTSANVMGLAASGDTPFQLGVFGLFVFVEGYGSIALQDTIDPAYADWDVTGSFAPYISPGSLLAANGANAVTGEAGIVLLAPLDASGLGTSYCGPAAVNSAGLSAVISATGSTVVGANDVTLTADDLPAGQFGYFLASRTQGSFNPPGSQGIICLSGNIGRYDQVANVIQGPTGSIRIDLTAVPVNPPQAVLPGDTWNFQCWYRDGTTSNFTDGVSISFR